MSSAPLKRLPPLASTGVGSLPFARPTAAAAHARRAYELPFCPQLPRLDGDMVAEWLGSDPGRCGWAADRDRERPAAWDAFLAQLAADPPAHGIVKLQVTGPLTLAMALERAAGRPGCGREAHALAVEVASWLAASAAAQARALTDLRLATLLVVDEPGLASAGLPASAAGIWDPLRAAADAWGLHVCGAVPWELIDAAEPDAVSFDISREPLGRSARAALARLLARDGRVIWGVVDPVDPGDAGTAAALLSGAIAALAGDGSPGWLAAASLASPSCGSGRLSVAGERLLAAVLAAAVGAVRDAVAALNLPRLEASA